MKKQNTVSTFRVQDFSFDILKKKKWRYLIWIFESFNWSKHLIYFKIISLDDTQRGLICNYKIKMETTYILETKSIKMFNGSMT